ncbi:MAG: response regulator, partial [Rhodospirillales bacterium]
MKAYNISALHFLVVDDNPNMRKLVAQILRVFGCTVIREAEDGADALKVITTWMPDMVIT